MSPQDARELLEVCADLRTVARRINQIWNASDADTRRQIDFLADGIDEWRADALEALAKQKVTQ